MAQFSRVLLTLLSLTLSLASQAHGAQDTMPRRPLLQIRIPERPTVSNNKYMKDRPQFPQEPGPRPTFKSSQLNKATQIVPAVSLGSTPKTPPKATSTDNDTYNFAFEVTIPKKWVKALRVIFADPVDLTKRAVPEDRVREERGEDDNLNRGFTAQQEAYLVPEWTTNFSEAATWIDVLHMPVRMGSLRPIGEHPGDNVYVSTKNAISEAQKVTGVSLCRLPKSKLGSTRVCCSSMENGGSGSVWQSQDLNSVRGGDNLYICFSAERAGAVVTARLPLEEIVSE